MCWALSMLRHLVLTTAQRGDGWLHCTDEPRDDTSGHPMPCNQQRMESSLNSESSYFSLRGIVFFPSLRNDIERFWKKWSWLLIQEAVARLELGGRWEEPLGQGPGEGSWIADDHSFSPSCCLDYYLIPRLCYNFWGEKTGLYAVLPPPPNALIPERPTSYLMGVWCEEFWIVLLIQSFLCQVRLAHVDPGTSATPFGS